MTFFARLRPLAWKGLGKIMTHDALVLYETNPESWELYLRQDVSDAEIAELQKLNGFYVGCLIQPDIESGIEDKILAVRSKLETGDGWHKVAQSQDDSNISRVIEASKGRLHFFSMGQIL